MPYRPFDRHQVFTLPPALDDWVAADHTVRFVAAFLDALPPEEYQVMGLDLVGAARGAPAYHPLVLLGACTPMQWVRDDATTPAQLDADAAHCQQEAWREARLRSTHARPRCTWRWLPRVWAPGMK